jgi:hypothetical protein
MQQDKNRINLLMSHHGQLRWFSSKLVDAPSWEIWQAEPGMDSILVPVVVSHATDGQANYRTFDFKKGWIPHYETVFIPSEHLLPTFSTGPRAAASAIADSISSSNRTCPCLHGEIQSIRFQTRSRPSPRSLWPVSGLRLRPPRHA